MSATKIGGLILLACGILALAYGGFTYTKSTEEVELGPISLEVTEKERVNVPIWLGVGLSVIGAGLLLVSGKRA